MTISKRLTPAILLLALCAGEALSQSVTGTVTGTVLDASGALVPDARVTLTNEATNASRQSPTSEAGVFVFAAVAPGSYRVRVEHASFKATERQGLILTANQRLSLGDIHLEVGQTSESIVVKGDATVVQTESAEQTALLTPQQLDKMVVRGRDVINLIRLLPGVAQGNFHANGTVLADSNSGFGAQALGGNFGTGNPVVAGMRGSAGTIAVDGQSGNDPAVSGSFNGATSVDAIVEVQVVLNGFAAEYGRNAGAHINIVSKSGTRDFRGSAYWFKRHEQFNANDFFANRSGLKKPLYRYNTFGGTLGGPVYIPGKFNTDRDKIFFFVSREDWRILTPNSAPRITVPTSLERAGDFSASTLLPRDPATGAAFPGNRIPASRINPGFQKLFNLMPLPNQLDRSVTGGQYNYEWRNVQEQPKHINLLKLDFVPTPKDTVALRGRQWVSDLRGYQANASFQNTNFPLLQHRYLFTESGVNLAWTHVFAPNLINEVNTGVRGLKELGTFDELTDLSKVQRKALGIEIPQFRPQLNPLNIIPQLTFGSAIPAPPVIQVDGRFPINCGDNRYTFSDNFSWIHGGHSLKFGVFFERNWSSEGTRANQFSGSFNFSADANNPLNAVNPFANALLGNFLAYNEQTNLATVKTESALWEWFAQDTWKATRRLTLSYGLRFSRTTPWTPRSPAAMLVFDRYDPAKAPVLYRPFSRTEAVNPLTGERVPGALAGFFVPNSGDPANGMVLDHSGTYPDAWLDQPPIQVAPRFGFALDVFGNGATALRGSFGITKQAMLSNQQYAGAPAQSPPVQYSPQVFYGNVNTLLQASGLLAPSAVTSAERNPKTPSTYNYSLGIQQRIGSATVLDVSYVGNTSRHLQQARNLNLLPYGVKFLPQNANPANPSTALQDNFLRRYQGYSNVTYTENSGYANYNGLHVALNRRYAESFQFGVAYTWSKAMGLTDADAGGLPLYNDYRTWSYSRLGHDQTHKLIINGIYDVPAISSRLGIAPAKWVLDGWQLSGVATMSSGLPRGIGFSTQPSADLTGGGDGQRVNLVAPVVLSRGERTFDRWFNTSAIALPARGDRGNAASDLFRGPGIHNYDLSVFKRFPIHGERTYLQFRTEFYNVFNHTQYEGLDTGARFNPNTGAQTNARLGQVTSTRLPRIIQFALNLYF